MGEVVRPGQVPFAVSCDLSFPVTRLPEKLRFDTLVAAKPSKLAFSNLNPVNRHTGQPGIVETVDVDRIGETACVHDRFGRSRPDQENRFANDHVFRVRARGNIDGEPAAAAARAAVIVL